MSVSQILKIRGIQPTRFVTDEGRLYVSITRMGDQRAEYRVGGLNQRLLLRMHGALVEKCEIEPIPFRDLRFVQSAMPLRMELAAQPWPEDDVADLIQFLDSAEAAPLSDRRPSAVRPDKAFDLGELWQSLIELEGEFIPTVTIVRHVSTTRDGSIFEYEAERSFDFAEDSIVEVRIPDGRRGRLIGQLNLAGLDDRTLAIRNLSSSLSGGEDVILVEKRAQASLDRRRRGVNRVLSRNSAIPDLLDFFDPYETLKPTTFALVPNATDMAGYGLNLGQSKAFEELLGKGPVGLLQGPPGTGKTRFIGALVHWLVTRAGARKVLVASQSHEAVNGAAEELIKLFRGRGDHLNLLRVGTKGLTSRLAPYQSVSLRERYQRRFIAGLKGRLAAAGVALGINRNLIYDLVDLDRALGIVARRIFLLEESLASEQIEAEEARRARQRLSSANRVFGLAASAFLERDVDAQGEHVAVVLEEAHDKLLARHATSTRADLASARRLLALAHEWVEALGSGHRNFEEFLAKTRSVIAGTCVGLGQTRIRLESGTFDWVIIDEAARCTAGELAVPIQLGRRVLLVGDHLQLPPMIDREIVQLAAKEIPGVEEKDVERSDFERAFSSTYGKKTGQVLEEQYRMVEPICRLVSATFYAPHGVRLTTSTGREPDPRFARELPLLLSRPVTWIDTSKSQRFRENQQHKNMRIWNEAEIDVTIRLLALIAGEADFAKSLADGEEMGIGVICMYKEQKRRIAMAFAQRPFDDAFRRTVKIDTVDSYQGKENAIVIVSLVRSNTRFAAGHVRIPNRCNVALSRARERLYILGDTGMWSDPRVHSPMREVLKSISATKDGMAAVVMAGEVH